MVDHSQIGHVDPTSRLRMGEIVQLQGEDELAERFREITALSVLLREQEHLCEAAEVRSDWLREIAAVLLTLPRWWGLMPAKWRQKRELRTLQSRGLFDGDAYLKQYPDVAATGMNPLQHYLLHGIHEGRPRSVPQA